MEFLAGVCSWNALSDVEELRNNYLNIITSASFQKVSITLLKTYVGRPTPLYFAKRLSEKYKTKIYLKREDLYHTGAHKVNNTIGQILLAKVIGQIKNHSRDRRWPTWCGYGNGLRADGFGVHRVYRQSWHGTAAAECWTHANTRN